VRSEPVKLTYDLSVTSNDDTKTVGGFDGHGNAMPAEMLPAELTFDGVKFQMGPAGTGKKDAVAAKGQTIHLPSGRFNRVYVLAAAEDGDQTGTFRAGSRAVNLTVEDWGGFIGQWDTREWKPEPATTMAGFGDQRHEVPLRHDWAVSANHATWDIENRGSANWSPRYPEDYIGLKPGFIKRADLVWFCSHHHTAAGLNEPYQYSYLFAYPIDLPAGAKTLTLPNNDKIRVLAVSVAEEGTDVKPVHPLYDTLK
jgi:alpha-mannosidase